MTGHALRSKGETGLTTVSCTAAATGVGLHVDTTAHILGRIAVHSTRRDYCHTRSVIGATLYVTMVTSHHRF